MQTDTTAPGRAFAERILRDLAEIREEVATLRRFANLLGKPAEGQEESFMTVTMHLLGLLVSGTEETHRRLEALHGTLVDPRVTAGIRAAILET